jgi:hypothetical protein
MGQSLATIDFSWIDPYRSYSSMREHSYPPFGDSQVAVIAGEDLRHASWFADEVGIDFPSVAGAVDRMRRAFLAAERPAPESAVIQLSRREAHAGVIAPLEVPLVCTCRRCGGRGESWTEPCPRCDGRGTERLRRQLRVTIPAGVRHGTRYLFTVTPPHNPPTRIELSVLVA